MSHRSTKLDKDEQAGISVGFKNIAFVLFVWDWKTNSLSPEPASPYETATSEKFY